MITQGRDGRYSGWAVGHMGRTVVADGSTPEEAEARLNHMLLLQEAECYHHEQAMTHRSLVRDGEV